MWLFKKKEIILSKRKYSDYLPIGTIVKLYNDDKEYMICRYLGNVCMSFRSSNKSLKKSHIYKEKKDVKKIYYHVDYEIVPYPYGNDSFTYSLLYIKHEDIKEIIYPGYNDEYRKNILNDIDKWNEKGDKNE